MEIETEIGRIYDEVVHGAWRGVTMARNQVIAHLQRIFHRLLSSRSIKTFHPINLSRHVAAKIM